MKLVDLTRDFTGGRWPNRTEEVTVPLKSEATSYTGIIYKIFADSMTGTYIDFPGHIRETDDNLAADCFPVAELYRTRAAVVHLDCPDRYGEVTGEELQAAYGSLPDAPVLIINALGGKNPHDIELRSVYLGDSAVDWILRSGCKYLISDIYESQALKGVFLALFRRGVCAVCEPVNLALLTGSEVRVTLLFPKFANLKQVPCRLVAEVEE